MDEVGADETGSTGDEQAVHAAVMPTVNGRPVGIGPLGSPPCAGIILAGGSGTPAAPDHPGDQQAARAGLRQADDLLPAVDADAGRDPRRPGHHDAARRRRSSSGCSATARSSGIVDHATPQQPSPDGLAQAFVIGADFIGGDAVGAGARRQHLLRPRTRARSCAGSSDLDGAAVFAYQVAEPDRVRRGRVRRRRHGALARGEAGEAEEQLRRPRPLLLRQRRRRDRPRA